MAFPRGAWVAKERGRIRWKVRVPKERWWVGRVPSREVECQGTSGLRHGQELKRRWQPAKTVGQRCQPIKSHVQKLQVAQLAQSLWQRLQCVVGNVERFEVGKRRHKGLRQADEHVA